ncbi:hypothetical protein [Pelotomaculum propionicicum]|uniref:Uncharacterized protein n=1 Tax=Pelotomaculum propionicicum TaxID=258475 RepID=A0A4Y7RPI4_9FIRM|nr:hypothetical protein [Pelotomaculum propionicicum]TEB10650.1 hypothetical protein Pmgp_02230 [Pelotomaculum propionicicum]
MEITLREFYQSMEKGRPGVGGTMETARRGPGGKEGMLVVRPFFIIS